MKKGFIGNRSNSKPPNYYRSHISREDIRRAMEDKGPLSITQMAAMLGDKVPPEAKQRYMKMHHHCASGYSLEGQLFSGMRRIVQTIMPHLIKCGKVKKHGVGREAKYEWIEAQDGQAGQDSA